MLPAQPATPSAVQQIRQFRAGSSSPVDFARAALRAADDHSHLNFLRCIDPDRVLAEARASEQRWTRGQPKGELDGVLFTAKDNCLVSGWTTRWGSLTRAQVSTEDSPAVARLREEGAIILGMTVMPEFGWKGVCDSPLHGVTRNPWNPERTCGGSSGGAAVAASLGVAALNVGTDGAGSIRIPAAFCGVVGFKPTYGLVPAYPVGSLPNFTHVGPIARDAADALLMFDVLQRADRRDWQAIPFALPPGGGIDRPRAAYSRTLGYARVDEDVLAATDAAVDGLRRIGWRIDDVDPGFADPYGIIRPLYFAAFAHMVKQLDPGLRDRIDPGLREEIDANGPGSADEVIDALTKRDALGRFMNAFHAGYDILITPTMPLGAFEAGLDVPAGRFMKSWFDWNPFTFPFNLTQQPAASVPCGLTRDGMPVGLQFVGPRYGDRQVLHACRAFEGAGEGSI